MTRPILTLALAASLAGCSPANDPVADLIAGFTAADSAAAAFLGVQTNADTRARVKACEAAAYGVLEPIKVAWIAKQPVAPVALQAGLGAMATFRPCLTANGVKL